MNEGTIEKATISDLKPITSLIDNHFTKEGFGFVNRAQIQTEILKGRVVIAIEDKELVGVRIGLGTVWNLVVCKQARGKGIGRSLIEYSRPHTIRVKSDPIGHLSKEQMFNFVDPSGFYEALGYKLWGYSFPRNFWQRGKGGKGQFHIRGSKPHIRIYKDPTALLLPIGGDSV